MAASFFHHPVSFIFGAQLPEQLDHSELPDDLPEWAIAGRSNVGKSSLINALFQRKKLARISNTPGRTRQINFFDCNALAVMADLPGYGYAKVSKQQRALWDKLMASYFSYRTNLRLVLVLIDSRHPPKQSDYDMMTYLDAQALPYICVFTKIDKIPTKNLNDHMDEIKVGLRDHPAALENIFAVSAHKNEGLDELRTFIASYLDIPGASSRVKIGKS